MQKEPMTKYGYEKVRTELEHLKNVERSQVAAEIAEARGHGDLSENAEYDAAKEKQQHLERRIAELSDVISKAQVIDPTTLNHTRVCFGSSVKVEDTKSEEVICYTIVGGVESNPTSGLISFNSPLAKQLLGKVEGDVLNCELPGGFRELEVIEIFYKEITFS